MASAAFSTVPAWRRLGRGALAGLLWWAASAQALQIQAVNRAVDGAQAGIARGLSLTGELVPGDTAKLVQWIRRQPADAWHGLGRVDLKITGGDSREALLLADTLATLYPHMVSRADCAGPCAIVWLAGAWRLAPEGKIGLQQPAAGPAADSTQRPIDAPPAYDPFPAQLRSYLLKQGLPLPLYERWQADRSGPVYWLSAQDINATGTWPPYYYDKLHAACPQLAGSNESFHALRRCAAGLAISQKAFAFDRLLAGADNAWWNENRSLYLSLPR